MVGTTLKMRIDENASEKYNQVQLKKDKPITEVKTKRAALGDLQNRDVLRNIATKDAAQKDLKDVKLQNNIRNTKARVDSFWKKAPLGTSNVNNAVVGGTKSTLAASNAAAAAAETQRRMLLRSNSVRLGTVAANTANMTGLQRHVTANLQPQQTKTLINGKMVETKKTATTAAAVAVAEKPKQKSGDDLKKSNVEGTTTTTLRREDSNLSRKSLTRLRAALSRENVAATTASVKPLSAKLTKNAVTKKEAAVPTAEPSTTKVKVAPKSADSAQAATATLAHSSIRFEDIVDIDGEDSDNLVLVSEYVNDIYDYLYKVEVDQCIRKHHLSGQEEVHSKMRAVLIDWINEVHLQFHLAAETFHLAVAIVDRYLQSVKDTKRMNLQLVGVTALFIATKYEELFPPAIGDFVYITDDTYTSKQIRLMELQIFKSLDYNLARPLPIHFLRRFSKAAGAEDAHHAMSKYFLELAAIEYELAHYKPSEIAAASLFLSLHLLNSNAKAATGFNNKHWTPTLGYYSRYSADHLRPITKLIATVARNAPHAKLKSVYTKYQSTKFQKIALRTELYGALMDSIVNSKE